MSRLELAVRCDQAASAALRVGAAVGIDRSGDQLVDQVLSLVERRLAPGASHAWLLEPHADLDGLRPLDCAERGDLGRVVELLELA
jgi:hypothetical protein